MVLPEIWGILRQMEEFVGTTQANRVGSVSQVLNGIFQAFLALSTLGALVRLCLFLRGLGLCLRRFLHRLGAPIGYHSLLGKQDAAHADSQKCQDFFFSE